MAYLVVLSQHLHRKAKKNHEDSATIAGSQAYVRTGYLKIQVRRVAATPFYLV
jgi:hypothetical protein